MSAGGLGAGVRALPEGRMHSGRPSVTTDGRWRGLAVLLGMLALALTGAILVLWTMDGYHRHNPTEGTTLLLVGVAYAAVGVVVGLKRPEHRLGWLFLAAGLLMLAGIGSNGYAQVAFDRSWAGTGVAALVGAVVGWPGMALGYGLVPLLYPTGYLLSPRWRWVAGVLIAGLVLGTMSGATRPTLSIDFSLSGGEQRAVAEELRATARELRATAPARAAEVERLELLANRLGDIVDPDAFKLPAEVRVDRVLAVAEEVAGAGPLLTALALELESAPPGAAESFLGELKDFGARLSRGFPDEVVNPLGVKLPDLLVTVLDVGLLGIVLGALAGLVSLFVRYHRGGTIERLQIRWIMMALLFLALLFAGANLLEQLSVGRPEDTIPFALGMAGIPVAAGLAILRYRLFEIDRIVSRTVTYAVVVGALVAVYAGVVVGLQSLIPADDGSDLIVAGSTLVVAALFSPLRRRVKGVVDRRFNRSRYDAALAADAFAARLREEVDLESVTTDLIDVVSRSLAPASASLWLRGEVTTGQSR